MTGHNVHTRRHFLVSTIAATGIALGSDGGAFGQTLTPTPECRDGDEPTIRQTEGPFYKPSSPQRADLREPGLRGRPVELSGVVLTRSCRPVAGALVDLWHADADGDYDNDGFRCRGHLFADAHGRYRFQTIIPALYPGRTRHYHVKVQAPQRPVLTTQLYFPGEAGNRRDGLFRRELLMRTGSAEGGLAARFDFVLDMR
ncbi:MAG: intradiol ring-cleavage dioxygenase [Rhizobiales bacterium]|nr:intradiol ring-cleavage dioxygenase [Hyphomicrobiales bacterium]